ncbi:PHD finger protein EHD3 [Amborella trichopoda]|uniref:PHD finger protein EHD3 n=1 Tax=Amborella trichopoda TaxID=13333 RepID=UPI0005D40494|nr:PHD finger protein EHD3 [Amborella trichopoda]|eukprot:XP_011625991.1 PHD finger protein EHD3 [Amborella trichopoda]
MKETEIPPNGSPCSLSMMDCSKDSSGPEFMSRSLDHPLATHLHDFENFKLVQNLKEYVAKRGIVLGPGWKAQISFCSRKGLHSYFSPSGKAFTSMKAAAKFLQEEREKELPMILASCSERFENISYRSASVCPHSIVLSKEIFLASSLRNQSLIKKVKFDPHASEPLALQSILPSGGNSFSGVGQHYDREAIDPVSEQLDEEGISYHQRPGKTRNYMALNDVLKEDNVDIAGRFPTKEGNHTEALRLEQCESIFHDVHISEQLTSLCDLFCGSFNDIKKGNIFGLNFIDLRMKSGLYAQSPEHFASDLRQICKHLLDIGQEMAVLAGDLLENFQTSHQKKQVNQQGTKETNSTLPRSTARKSSFHEFDLHPTPMELGACADGVCRLCGKNAEDDDCILICDGCEASYHMYCLSPALEEVPHGSWYCQACSAARKESSATNDTAENDEAAHSDIGDNGGMRHHCVVCERLYNLQLQKLKGENRMKRNSGNKSQWGKRSGGGIDPKDSDKMNNVSIIEEPKISIKKGSKESGSCKMCGSSKRGDKDMAKCANKGCFFKYYHILCLEPPLKSLPPPGWYCPSCLCRVCLIDENDDRIVLCDGCDEGYHTYCMNPSLLNIPKGKWYCSSCREKQIPNGLKIPRRVVP